MTSIADNLKKVRNRIQNATKSAGRADGAVHLLGVSKTRSADDVRVAYAEGLHAFGENYLQEALDKQSALEELPLEWHFIGPLQSNKTRSVAEHFAWLHSLDRSKIAQRLSQQRPAHLPPLQVLIQVNINDESSKSGVLPDAVPDLARLVDTLPGLQLRGLMTIPAAAQTDADLRASYQHMSRLLQGLRDDHPACDTLSMGMSADLELAIEEGATLVRIGTDLFGPRP